MQVVLVMFRADGERRSFSLSRDMTVVGRREDCDLRIPLGEVSRKHCRLIKEDPALRLEDLGSSNGTYLNGKRIQEAVVSPGDTIQIGPVVFVAQIEGEPAEEDMQPVMAQRAAAGEPSGSEGGEGEEAVTAAAAIGEDELPPGLEDSAIPEAEAMDFDLAEEPAGAAGGGAGEGESSTGEEGDAGASGEGIAAAALAGEDEPFDPEAIASEALQGGSEDAIEGDQIDLDEEEEAPRKGKKR